MCRRTRAPRFRSATPQGRLRLPKAVPEYYSPGNLDEAVIYIAGDGREAWAAVPGALAWLKGHERPTDVQKG